MKRILIIEDELQIVYAIESRLRAVYPHCEIKKAPNFYRAQTALDEYLKINCDLIISDLHMSGEGLEDDEDRPDGAVLNGWFFLRNYLLKESSTYHAVCEHAEIIIFSAFLDELKSYTNLKSEDKTLLSTIRQVPKGRIYSGDGGYTELMNTVRDILN